MVVCYRLFNLYDNIVTPKFVIVMKNNITVCGGIRNMEWTHECDYRIDMES